MRFSHQVELVERGKGFRIFKSESINARLDFVSNSSIRVAIFKDNEDILPTFNVAPNNEMRNEIMPINKAYPIHDLMDVLNYIETLKLPNFYIAAGSVFQTVWNYYDKKDLNYNIKDNILFNLSFSALT